MSTGFSSVLHTFKHLFRLNSLLPMLSTGKGRLTQIHLTQIYRCWHVFTLQSWGESFCEVPLFCYDKLTRVLTLFLRCFLSFHRIKNLTMWGFFSFHLVRESEYSLYMHYKTYWVFLLPWNRFTTGIKQLCTDRNSKSPTMAYNPVISGSLKGVWWNGQTLENGL